MEVMPQNVYEIIDEIAYEALMTLQQCVKDPENSDKVLNHCTKIARTLQLFSKTLETNRKSREASIKEAEDKAMQQQEALDLNNTSAKETVEILEGMLNYHRHRLPSDEPEPTSSIQ